MSETTKLYGINKLRETLVVAESTRKSMQGNRSIGTKPEVALRSALWHAGLRGYRKNVRKLSGSPDVVFGRAKIAVFVHGCFWHGHDCGKAKIPRLNNVFWSTKIERNRERDTQNVVALESKGFLVVTLWECQLKDSLQATVDQVRSLLKERA